VGVQCATFVGNINAEQNLMFQCLVHSVLRTRKGARSSWRALEAEWW